MAGGERNRCRPAAGTRAKALTQNSRPFGPSDGPHGQRLAFGRPATKALCEADQPIHHHEHTPDAVFRSGLAEAVEELLPMLSQPDVRRRCTKDDLTFRNHLLAWANLAPRSSLNPDSWQSSFERATVLL